MRMRAQIYEDKAGEHRWRIVAANGRIVAVSGEGFTRKASAKRSLRAIFEAWHEVLEQARELLQQ